MFAIRGRSYAKCQGSAEPRIVVRCSEYAAVDVDVAAAADVVDTIWMAPRDQLSK